MNNVLRPRFRDFRSITALKQGPYGCPLIDVQGEVDFSNRQELAEHLRLGNDQGQPIVFLDLRGLGFIDSSGVHVIQRASRAARDRGARLLIVKPSSPSVLRIFALTGLFEHVTMMPTLPGS